MKNKYLCTQIHYCQALKKATLLIFLAFSTLSAEAQMRESEKLGKAIEYFGGEKYHEALILFEGLSKKYSLNPRFYAYMGVCYFKEQDYTHAAEVLDSIIPHLEPFPPHERGIYYYSCAESHFLLGDYATALSYYEMTLPVAFEREKGDIYYRMGCCGMMMQSDSIQIENFRLAHKWFEKADMSIPETRAHRKQTEIMLRALLVTHGLSGTDVAGEEARDDENQNTDNQGSDIDKKE